MLFDEFKADIERLHEIAVQLLNIAEKELTDRPLTVQDYEVILYFGRTIEEIAESGVTPISGPGPDTEAKMPVVADVHTDGLSFTVLEEGVGYPYCIYAICPIEGQLVLARGAAFSYYELTQPIENRLTDEQWRQMLQSNDPPVVPTWTGSFAAETDWRNPDPDFYYCQLPVIGMPWISLPTDSFRVGEKVRADIRYHVAPVSGGTLEVWIETVAGEKSQADSLLYLGNDNFRAVLSTTGLTPGKAWVVAQAPAPDILSSDSLQTYRAGFIIDDPTSVDQSPQTELPQAFALLPPWPNPFNAGVAIAFDLPNPSTCVLQVFDVTGRLVRRLARGAFPAGQHHLRWDGRDDREQMLASGIYLIRFVAGKHDETRKIILLR